MNCCLKSVEICLLREKGKHYYVLVDDGYIITSACLQMSEGEGTLVDKSESSSFEDLAAAAAQEIEEAKLAEAAAAKDKSDADETKTDEWQDVLGSGALLKKVRQECDYESRHYILHIHIFTYKPYNRISLL